MALKREYYCISAKEVQLIRPLICADERRYYKYRTRFLNLLKFPHSLGKEMLRTHNDKDLVLEINLSEPRCTVPFNKFVNKSKDKRLYYDLMRELRNCKGQKSY